MDDSSDENEYDESRENTSNEEQEDLDRYTKRLQNAVQLFFNRNENLEMFLYHHEIEVLEANEVIVKEFFKFKTKCTFKGSLFNLS